MSAPHGTWGHEVITPEQAAGILSIIRKIFTTTTDTKHETETKQPQ